MNESMTSASLAMLTDLYQLTMAYGYWKLGRADDIAVFHLNYRKAPFHGIYAIAAGLDTALEAIENFRFTKEDVDYLSSLKGPDMAPLFEKAFLDFLLTLRIECDIDAVEEGTVVFPQEPILRVKGPLLQAQIIESLLLNIINFQTLIATKAARMAWAAKSDPLIEFGLRRAQGSNGALSAARAAFIGGVNATSNVLAGMKYGIPVKGTQSHSWVMAFENEEDSFYSFGKILPGNCIFLVDTYDTLRGVRRAIETAKKLKEENIEMIGIRLDSGDLADLSIKVRKILDSEGFSHVKILASNELDENIIQNLKVQNAKIDVWCVGTSLVTAKEHSSLDGVYKLSAISKKGEPWRYCIKLSEQTAKVTMPGIMQVRRFQKNGEWIGDVIFDENSSLEGDVTALDYTDPLLAIKFKKNLTFMDLLKPVMKKGKRLRGTLPLFVLQENCKKNLAGFPETMHRFLHPQAYFVGVEKGLFDKKMSLIQLLRTEESV